MKLINFYPPYWAAGIRLAKIEEDFYTIHSELRLRWWNKNLFGTHFGGSLYAMCDPFFVFILVGKLGPDYIIWDKAASIQFKKPGRGKVTARFHIPPEKVEAIQLEVDKLGKKDYIFHTQVIGEEGEIVAEVEKLVYVRKKGSLG